MGKLPADSSWVFAMEASLARLTAPSGAPLLMVTPVLQPATVAYRSSVEVGGGGAEVLVGGEGDSIVIGQSSRDLLVGGFATSHFADPFSVTAQVI